MKKNIVKIGDLVLKLGIFLKTKDYYIDTVKLGNQKRVVKICDIIRVDWCICYSSISLSDGGFVDDSRSIAEIALLLPYNHFGYYRRGCIFNMHSVESIDRKAMRVVLGNKTKVIFETRTVFKRFDEDYFNLNS